MALPIFPTSPMPAELDRTPYWKVDAVNYDSGAYQAVTPFQKPLYRWSIPIKLMTEVRQSSLFNFWNSLKGRTQPFLMKDPYDFRVNSALAVNSGTGAGSLFLYDINSYSVRADTTTIGSLFSAISGYVTLGVEYNYNQDTGVLTVVTKSNTDTWGVRSMQYYRKCVFGEDYRERSIIWNLFGAQLSIKEIV